MTENPNANGSAAVAPSNLQFPTYPAPKGVTIAPPKFHSPLYKLMKMMMKPKRQVFHTRKKSLTHKGRHSKKKVRFY